MLGKLQACHLYLACKGKSLDVAFACSMTMIPGRVKVYCDILLAYTGTLDQNQNIRLHAVHGVKHRLGPDRAHTWYR